MIPIRFPGGQGVGLQGPRGPRGRPTGFPGGQGVELQGPRGVKGKLNVSHRINSNISTSQGSNEVKRAV